MSSLNFEFWMQFPPKWLSFFYKQQPLNFSHIIITYTNYNIMQTDIAQHQIDLEEAHSWSEAQRPFQLCRDETCDWPIYKRSAYWGQKENLRFLVFLHRFHTALEGLNKQQKWIFFEAMADFLKTRNTNQCRSYYSKLKHRFVNAGGIVLGLGNSYKNLQKSFEEYSQELENYNERIQELYDLSKSKKNQNKERSSDGSGVQKNVREFKTDTDYAPECPTKKLYKVGCSLPEPFMKVFYPWLMNSQNDEERPRQNSLFGGSFFRVGPNKMYQ